MANYFIIGGDGKEYGPVTEADVRQWIAEGRLSTESRAKAEGKAEFRALGLFPEFAAALQAPGATAAPPQTPSSTDFLERDYELDIGVCISKGWELFKENFGTLFVACLIMFAVQIGFFVGLGLVMAPLNKILMHAPVAAQVLVRFLIPVVTSVVVGPMSGGVYLVFLKKIRRQETGVGDVFAGFQYAFAQLYLGALAVGLITGACMLPFQYVWQAKAGVLLEQMQHMQSDPTGMQSLLPQLMSAFGGALPVLLICVVPVTFLAISFFFTLPLIIDKQMDFATAMKTSWKMVMKHWWHVFGLTVLSGLLSLLGAFACCVGLLFTVPIGIAALMFGYETIFGAQKT